MHEWNWVDESEEGGEEGDATNMHAMRREAREMEGNTDWEAAGCCGHSEGDVPAEGTKLGQRGGGGTWQSHQLLFSAAAQDFMFESRIYSKILSRMEWFGILENLRKNKYAAEL